MDTHSYTHGYKRGKAENNRTSMENGNIWDAMWKGNEDGNSFYLYQI